MTALFLPSPAKIRATQFALQRQQAFNPLRGGHHQAVDMGASLWTCEIETTPLSREQGGVWKSLLARLRGFTRGLYLYDASRRRPLAYRDASDGSIGRIAPVPGRRIGQPRRIASVARAWGEPVIDAVDRANSRIRVRGFTPGATISEGDYGCWNDGSARRLHILSAITADSGGNAWISVEPAPPETSANLPAPFEMHEAAAEFVVIESATPYAAQALHQASLKAIQVLRSS